MHARFEDPFGIAARPDGTIFVSDGLEAPRVRSILPDGSVVDIAGGRRGFEDGRGASARFGTISGLAVAADGTLYVADTANNAIRRIASDGQVTTLAGDGLPGYRDGPAATAQFNGPLGVAVDPAGRVIVADTYNDRIRRIELDGTVATLATSYFFNTPTGVAVGAAGSIYVADAGSGSIHVVDAAGEVTTLPAPYPEPLGRPIGVAVAAGGEVYVTDERGRILEFDSRGSTRVVAGSSPGFVDGAGSDARFRRPSGIAVLAPGRLIVADTGNALVRLIAATSRFEFRAPPIPGINPRFDRETFGRQPLLWPVAPMDGPHEIAGTMGEARGTDAERLHAGIDVRIDEGTPVFATRAGVVSSPVSTGEFGSLNEWLRVGPMTYVHIKSGRDRAGTPLQADRFVAAYDDGGVLVGMRVKRGARFESGDLIGSVNRFNHVHMNVGWPGEELNPLGFQPAALLRQHRAEHRAQWRHLARRQWRADRAEGARQAGRHGTAADRRRCLGSGRWQSSESASCAPRPGLPGAAARWFRGRGLRASSRNHPHGSTRPLRRRPPDLCGRQWHSVLRRETHPISVHCDEHLPRRDRLGWTLGYAHTRAR